MGRIKFTPTGPSYYGRGTAQSLSELGDGQDASTQENTPGPGGTDAEPADPGSGYLWTEDFDRYTADSPLSLTYNNPACGTTYPDAQATYGTRTIPNTGNACQLQQPVSFITGRGGSGIAIRSTLPTGYTGSNLISPYPTYTLGDYDNSGRTIVMQLWFRLSVGGSIGSGGTKWFEAWYSGYNQSRMQTGMYPSSGFTFSDANTDTGSINRTPQPLDPFVCGSHPGKTVLDDGLWHRFTFLYRMNTSSTFQNVSGTNSAQQDLTYTGTSSRDGRLAVWLDGNLVADFQQSKVGVTPAGGTGVWCLQCDVDSIMPRGWVRYFKYPDVINNVDVGFTLDHDDFKVWVP